MADEPKTMTAEEAERVLRSALDERIKTCQEEVDAVLKKHNCAVDISMLLTAQGCTPRLRVVPIPPQQQ